MRKRDPRPVMVIDEGKCQLIGEAKGNEFDGVQEPLPDAMRLLLCLIDGEERRHRLVRKWQSQAAHDLHVEVEGDDIMVTLPGTSYAVTYYKPANFPQLHGRHLPEQVDRRSPISQAAFVGKAWKLANAKARVGVDCLKGAPTEADASLNMRSPCPSRQRNDNIYQREKCQ